MSVSVLLFGPYNSVVTLDAVIGAIVLLRLEGQLFAPYTC